MLFLHLLFDWNHYFDQDPKLNATNKVFNEQIYGYNSLYCRLCIFEKIGNTAIVINSESCQLLVESSSFVNCKGDELTGGIRVDCSDIGKVVLSKVCAYMCFSNRNNEFCIISGDDVKGIEIEFFLISVSDCASSEVEGEKMTIGFKYSQFKADLFNSSNNYNNHYPGLYCGDLRNGLLINSLFCNDSTNGASIILIEGGYKNNFIRSSFISNKARDQGSDLIRIYNEAEISLKNCIFSENKVHDYYINIRSNLVSIIECEVEKLFTISGNPLTENTRPFIDIYHLYYLNTHYCLASLPPVFYQKCTEMFSLFRLNSSILFSLFLPLVLFQNYN